MTQDSNVGNNSYWHRALFSGFFDDFSAIPSYRHAEVASQTTILAELDLKVDSVKLKFDRVELFFVKTSV